MQEKPWKSKEEEEEEEEERDGAKIENSISIDWANNERIDS